MTRTHPNLTELLEFWFVAAPGMWDNDDGTIGWWAVGNDDQGLIAYFKNEQDAFRFRLDQINRTLNG